METLLVESPYLALSQDHVLTRFLSFSIDGAQYPPTAEELKAITEKPAPVEKPPPAEKVTKEKEAAVSLSEKPERRRKAPVQPGDEDETALRRTARESVSLSYFLSTRQIR